MDIGKSSLLAKVYFRLIDLLHRPFVETSGTDPYHRVFREFVALTQQENSPSILEIGSRIVTGISHRTLFGHCPDYVGFDVLPGDGVDTVGDAHKLSTYFPDARQFDFVFSISVFEHLLFPWKVVLEINRVLRTGGYVFVGTHPTWPPHHLPWDFWRFPVNGLAALFNDYTGFEIVSTLEGLPCKIYSLAGDPPTRTNCYHTLNQGVALLARKTDEYRSDLLKWEIDVPDVVDTMYPST